MRVREGLYSSVETRAVLNGGELSGLRWKGA